MIVPVIVPLKVALLGEFQTPNIEARILFGAFAGEPGVIRPFKNNSALLTGSTPTTLERKELFPSNRSHMNLRVAKS